MEQITNEQFPDKETGDKLTASEVNLLKDKINEAATEISDLETKTSVAAEEYNSVLLFDKNKYSSEALTQSGSIVYSLAASGHIDGVVIRHKILSDSSTISFPSGAFVYPTNPAFDSGSIYEIWFTYLGGDLIVNIPGASENTSNAIYLSTPTDFTATSVGSTNINLGWVDVENESNYEIQRSADNETWVTIANPDSNVTSYSDTNLESSTTYYYRIRAIGNGTTYVNSPYSASVSYTTIAGDASIPITWTGLVNATATGNNLESTATTLYDGYAIATQSMIADGFIMADLSDVNHWGLIGFNTTNESQKFTSYEYYVGVANSTENNYFYGVKQAVTVTEIDWLQGDIMRLRRDSGVIYAEYSRDNGLSWNLIHQFPTVNNQTMYLGGNPYRNDFAGLINVRGEGIA